MMIFPSLWEKGMSFCDVCNGDWESRKRIFALRSKNCSETHLLGLASVLINHQAQMAPPAANTAPANMTARKPATKERSIASRNWARTADGMFCGRSAAANLARCWSSDCRIEEGKSDNFISRV